MSHRVVRWTQVRQARSVRSRRLHEAGPTRTQTVKRRTSIPHVPDRQGRATRAAGEVCNAETLS